MRWVLHASVCRSPKYSHVCSWPCATDGHGQFYNAVGARFKGEKGLKKAVIEKALASGLKNQANSKVKP